MQRSNSLTIECMNDLERQSSYSSFDDDAQTVQYEKEDWEVYPSASTSPQTSNDINWAEDYDEFSEPSEPIEEEDFILGGNLPTIKNYYNKSCADDKIRKDARYIPAWNYQFYCAENAEEAKRIPKNKYDEVLIVPRTAMMHVMKSCRAITAELYKYGLVFLYLYVGKRVISLSIAKDSPGKNPDYIWSKLIKTITQISREVLSALGEKLSGRRLEMTKASAWENTELFNELEQNFPKTGAEFQNMMNKWKILMILPVFSDNQNRRGFDWNKYNRGLDGVEWSGNKHYIIGK